MKAVLVIDMPDNINISKVRIGGDGNIYFMRDGERASIVGNIRNIRPLPQRMRTDGDDIEEDSYWQGWNDCISAITGVIEWK